MKKTGRGISSIFTKQEVLISCSSLREIDTQYFQSNREERQLRVSDLFMPELIGTFRTDIQNHTERVAVNIKRQFPNTPTEKLVTEILLNRRYRRGKRGDNNPEMILDKVTHSVNQNKPIELTISLFPCKVPNRLKVAGFLPDLAEVASIARLGELGTTVSQVYGPGAKIIILTDGKRFQDILNFDPTLLNAYQEQLGQIVDALGVGQQIELIEYVDFLNIHLPVDKIDEKKEEYERLLSEYGQIVGNSLPLDNPQEYLENLKNNTTPGSIVDKIVQLFYSLLYSNYFPEISENPQADHITKQVYSNLFDFNPITNPEVVLLRKKIITDTWSATRKYVAEIASGRVVKPVEQVFPNSIRCDMHNISERLTLYSVDRSTPLTAFHGTGYIDNHLHPSVRFRVSLQNEGFSPVYGTFLSKNYTKQPLFYFPNSLSKGLSTLPESLISNIHLR